MALRKHQEIFLPESETPFFEDPYYCESDLRGLFAALRNARPYQVAGIKRPNYLCTPGCAERLATHVPGARLIAMLRNPVERAVSQYFHLVRSGRIPVEDPNRAFGRYLSGEFESPFLDRAILKFGLYAAGLSEYVRLFPHERIIVFTDMDLNRDSADLFKQVCRFVGVTDGFVPKTISLRRNQGVYSLPLLALIRSLNAWGHAFVRPTGVAEQRRDILARTARFSAVFASRVSGFSRMLAYDSGPVISAEIRARLLEYYLPDINKLESMMSVDLGAWKDFDSSVCQVPKVTGPAST
jgi:hypothetical protein